MRQKQLVKVDLFEKTIKIIAKINTKKSKEIELATLHLTETIITNQQKLSFILNECNRIDEL